MFFNFISSNFYLILLIPILSLVFIFLLYKSDKYLKISVNFFNLLAFFISIFLLILLLYKIPLNNINFSLDALSSFILCLYTFILAITTIYISSNTIDKKNYIYINLINLSVIYIILSNNLLASYISYLLLSPLITILLRIHNNKSFNLLFFQAIGDVLVLISIFILYNFTNTFDYILLSSSVLEGKIPNIDLTVISILICLGISFKLGLFPFYIWVNELNSLKSGLNILIKLINSICGIYILARLLPILYQANTVIVDDINLSNMVFIIVTGISILGMIIAILNKELATYSLYFSALILLIIAGSIIFTPLKFLSVIGSLTALCLSLFALTKKELNKTITYIFLSQIGFIISSLGIYKIDLNGAILPIGYIGSILHLFNYTFFILVLLMSIDTIISLSSKVNIDEIKGLKSYLPFIRVSFVLGIFALAGLPYLTFGYLSNMEVFINLWNFDFILFIFNIIGIVATIFSLFKIYFYIFEGELDLHINLNSPKIINNVIILITSILIIFWGLIGNILKEWIINFVYLIDNTNKLILEPIYTQDITSLIYLAILFLIIYIARYLYYKNVKVLHILKDKFRWIYVPIDNELFIEKSFLYISKYKSVLHN